ncbi:YfbK domain-containing protein [Actomonas aquatica]|uniref:von Willebrand factor type A domain-containing protein n=1 Tax=Actomonas aquatica TaxID=2866162 RepID=A0ABZ1C4G0_9BACT|nr:von Willebrand factor type A domain-containing protein [Opitutus sp. WL0086]WRQ86606.1 von Willebrand factor type A domain-containing protein [Opitutus sp. WL0086]
MNDRQMSPDDPRLTAYALGELEGEEARHVAAAVAADPALQAVVEDVRAMGDDLEGVLAAEALPEVEPVRPSELKDELYPFTPKKVVRFPVFWVSGLMAAGFAVMMVVYNRNNPGAQEQVITYDLDLTNLPPAPSATDGVAPATVPAPAPSVAAAELADDEVAVKGAGTLSAAPVESREVEPSSSFAVTEAPSWVTMDAPLLEATNLPAVVVQISREQALQAAKQRGDTVTLNADQPELVALGMGGNGTELTAASGNASNRPWGQTTGTLSAPALPGLRSDLSSRSYSSYIRPLMAPPARVVANTERYATVRESAWQIPTAQPTSTFAADVDTASYSNVRRFLQNGDLPPMDAVRIEELVNAFTYNYAPPTSEDEGPMAAHLEVAQAPWAPEHKLVRVGLKARDLSNAMRAPANLVFLLDVSGSMGASNKLPLAVRAMHLLVDQLRPDDRVAIVTYAGMSGLALPSTPMTNRSEIERALNGLQSGGSTNGENGIQLAYDVAKAHFVDGGINRVILCTDGDFNVGISGVGDLERLITEKAQTGVFLTALGFGMHNLQDQTLETLADRGNGQYGYIDSEQEARRLLVEQVEGTLATVAQDVKLQVEFNPRRVAAYRLIGYENRALARQDFADDRKDGGEVGAGQAVTALYEVVPVGSALPEEFIDVELADLRYQPATGTTAAAAAVNDVPLGADIDNELLVVHVRAKTPNGEVSRQWSYPLVDEDRSFAAASEDFRFASAVAGFGMVLRDSPRRAGLTLGEVKQWAQGAMGFDPGGRRQELLALIAAAERLVR